MNLLKKFLANWQSFFRGVLYPAGFFALIGLLISLFEPLTSQSIQINYFAILIAALLFAVVVIEFVILSSNKRLAGFKNQDEALLKFGPLSHQIEKAKLVHLLGTTFKSFSDDEANLRALLQSIVSGADVKILMINPNGEEISRMLIGRQDRNQFVSEELLRNEIRSSISRMQNALGEEICTKIVRFYRSTRSVSIYHIDDSYMVTCYTHGRGGSSPVITYKPVSDMNDEFADKFMLGFTELWDAKSTVDFRSVAAHAQRQSQ